MSLPVQPDESPRPLMSAGEVGAALGKSAGSVRRWTRDGVIPFEEITYSGAYAYDLEKVRAAADANLRRIRRPAGTR